MFESLKRIGFPFLVVLVVLAFYWKALGAWFNDNDLNELKNVLDLAPQWYVHPVYWRPVWHAVNHLAIISFGLNPLPYHLLILALYLCFLYLLYHFYTQVHEDKTASRIALILFATFYLHAEVVSRFVCLAELLWPLFGLTTLICFLRYRRRGYVRYYLLAIFFAILSIFTKEAGVCLPLLILTLDVYMGTLPLKERKYLRALLPYLPFIVVALGATVAFTTVPDTTFIESQILPYYALYQLPLLALKEGFYLVVYTLSPCFFGTKLNPLAVLLILILAGWVFYSSEQKVKRFLIFLLAGLVLTTLPYGLLGMVPRYTFFPSVFSSFLFAVLICEMVRRTYTRFSLRDYLSESQGIATLSFMLIFPLIYLNYQYVRQYGKNCVWAGELVREIVEGTAQIFPNGSGKSRVLYVNLPNRVQSEAPFTAIIVSFGEYTYLGDIRFYYLFHKINSPMNLIAVNIDLGYKKVGSSSAWYDICETARRISPEEYSALTVDTGNTLLFFNPLTEKLVDVSGWSYERLAESVTKISTRALN